MISPDWLHRHSTVLPGMVMVWTDLSGPDFKSEVSGKEHAAAVADLCRAAGMASGAWVHQVHGGTVLKADHDGCLGQADALWTDTPGRAVIGRSADCPLVLVAGPLPYGGRVAGFAHASWRSTLRGITTRLIEALVAAGARPEELEAVICPSAGPCCYEVGPEVLEEAEERLGPAATRSSFLRIDQKLHMDLWGANRAQLLKAGLLRENLRITGTCTICGESGGQQIYPSYRRQGHRAGRFAALVGFTAE